MRLVDATCPKCKAHLTLDLDRSKAFCEFCRSELVVDEGRKRISVKYDEAEMMGYAMERGRQKAIEEERQRQQREQTKIESSIQSYPTSGSYQSAPNDGSHQSSRANRTEQPVKKRKTGLWVLGWIFIFPVPLTILMLSCERTKSINIGIRIGIVVLGWLVYFAIYACSQSTGGTATTS